MSEENQNNVPAGDPVPAPAPTPAPPPAAKTVIEGERSEREIELESELEVAKTELFNTRGGKEQLEKEIAYLQDQLDKIKSIPAPPPAKKEKSWSEEFFSAS